MIEELKRHKWAYFILITGVTVWVVLFMGMWPNRQAQRLIVAGMALFYFLWGVSTHFKTQVITKKVIYEYGMIATLAGLLLTLITF